LAGIYLHIPFCKQACHYCNFHFSTSLRYKDEMVQALAGEATLQKGFLGAKEVETIYFGGGTPSLLSGDEVLLLLDTIRNHYTVSPGAEITLEANPDDITAEKLLLWKSAGVNRLSIGVQSFFGEELAWMNRAHTSVQSVAALELARTQFDNITMDLIYGSPLLSDAMWEENIHTAVRLGIPHLSCYALTVEEKTPLHKHIRARTKVNVEEDQQARQFLLGMQWLRAAGYEHYEVSNFAKPGFRSRHNSSYWKGVSYLGIGPSAHSYNGSTRQWNVANNRQYIESIRSGAIPATEETLSSRDRFNEYVMISLRTREGLQLARVEEEWGGEQRGTLLREAEQHVKSGQAVLQDGYLRLTDTGMLAADGIASGLFV
jgi:oxygen-independent coproporphyrinogen-3 oxidase